MSSRSTNRPSSQHPLVAKDARVRKKSTPTAPLRRATVDFAADQDSILSGTSTSHGNAGLKQISVRPLPTEGEAQNERRSRYAKSVSSPKPFRRATTSVLDVKQVAQAQGLFTQTEGDAVTNSVSPDETDETERENIVLGLSKREERGGSLCTMCATIPFSDLFCATPGKPQIRHRLPRVDPQKRSCRFCLFVATVSSQICESFASQDSWDYIRHRKSASLVSIPPHEPWYEVAGIKSNLPPAACAWLQFGTFDDQAPIEPYICISMCSQETPPEQRQRMAYSQPRERAAGREAAGMLDYNLVRSWIKICAESHADCGEPMVFKRSLLDLKLIDVRSRAIVQDDGYHAYAALSYVWGPALEAELSANKPTLMTNDLLPKPLPQTIEDAILATRELGLDFIWIDRFCIDQHDVVNVAEQIGNMDLVYECAQFTIVALAGGTIDHGLPGVSRPLEHTAQPDLNTGEYRFVATYIDSMWDHQGTKAWDHRGWTLQEGILSTRCIFFDKSHVYMRCRTELFHDTIPVDVSAEHIPTDQSSSYFWDNGFSLDVRLQRWDFSVYDALVANYTGRDLSVQADALSACSGALKRITRNTGVSFAWGLPHMDFSKALLWTAWHGNCIRRRHGFPSWSWTGWTGRTEYSYWLDAQQAYQGMMEDKWVDNAATSSSAVSQRQQLMAIQEEEAFAQQGHLHEGHGGHVLKISSTLIPFHGKFVRKQGRPRRLEPGSQQNRFAVGDQWTLTDGKGRMLENVVGDLMNFEATDHFIQLDPSTSADLRSSLGQAQLLFIKYWPAIRDHHDSENWLYDIVSALVIVHDGEGSATRLACVHMKLEDWLLAKPQPGVVRLV